MNVKFLSTIEFDELKLRDDYRDNQEKFIHEDGITPVDIPAADIFSYYLCDNHDEEFIVSQVEFHFRNDATRSMWGYPVTLETNLPNREDVVTCMQKASEVASEKLPKGSMMYLQWSDYIDTNDRFCLWIFIPYYWVEEHFKNGEEFIGWKKGLFQGISS